MKKGWIPIHRQLQEHWLWQDKPFSKGQAWIDLLMLANREDKKIPYKGKIITCKSGEVNRSILELSNRWGWSRRKAREFLTVLESDGMVSVNATTNRTTITIENYTLYTQKRTTKDTTKGQRTDNERTTSGQRADTNNNINNIDNIDNIDKYSATAPLEEAIKEFVDFRKKIKKPMTEHTVKLLLNKLNTLSADTEEQIAILNQSMLNGWQGVFPLKEPIKKSSAAAYGKNGIELDETKTDLDGLF